MSKIVFWSPYHGQGQTSNLHAAALIMSLLHKKRVLLMQTHLYKNNLEFPLVGQNANSGEKSDLFHDIGLDTAVTFSNMKKLNLKMLENCCLSFSNTSLLLLPGTGIRNRETFERDIGKSVINVIMDANACVDLVLIDANSGEDELSARLMSIADLIIINLTQRHYVLESFFDDYGEAFLHRKNVFYLFGDYDDNSVYNINNCREKYKKYIKRYNSGVIPYCTEYLDAQNECNVISFMREGLLVRSSKTRELKRNFHDLFGIGRYDREETDYFFHRSRLAVEKIFRLLDIPVRKSDRREEKHELQ